jgi:hypothetical protein
MTKTTPVNIEQIYQGYGLSSENELYRYLVESYFNGQLKQAKDIFSKIKDINTMKYNYIETFAENLAVWFDEETAKTIKKFFNI